MYLKLQPFIMIFSVITALTQGFTSEAATPLKSTVCTSYLLALRGDHLVPDISESLTGRALESIRRFRVDLIRQPLAVSDNKTILATSANVSSRDLLKIGRRIRGIETFLTNKKPDQIIAGSLYQGKESIENFLDVIESLREDHLSIERWTAALNGLSAYLSYLGAQGIIVELFDILHHAQTGNLMYGILKNLPSLAIDIGVMHPESLIKIPLGWEFDFNRKHSNMRELLKDTANTSGWSFDSMNYRLLISYTKKAWKAGKIEDNDLSKQNSFDTTRSLFIEKAIDASRIKNGADSQYIEAHTNAYIYLDRLLTKDPETGEPTLAVFLRISYEKPQTPTPPISVGAIEKIKNALSLPSTSAP